jgi:hypothetical protein
VKERCPFPLRNCHNLHFTEKQGWFNIMCIDLLTHNFPWMLTCPLTCPRPTLTCHCREVPFCSKNLCKCLRKSHKELLIHPYRLLCTKRRVLEV